MGPSNFEKKLIMEDQKYVFLNSVLRYELHTIKYSLILHVHFSVFSNIVVQSLPQPSFRTLASPPKYLF